MSNELPHRAASSRRTYFTETHAVHVYDDGEIKQDITQTADPSEVRDFMQKLVSVYESDVYTTPSDTETNPREALPMYAKVKDDGSVYIRDSEGGEYVMWVGHEWMAPRPEVDDFRSWNTSDVDPFEDDRTGINENVIGAVLNAIRLAYEGPAEIRTRFPVCNLRVAEDAS